MSTSSNSNTSNPASNSNPRLFNPKLYLLGPDRALEQPSDITHHILRYDASAGLTRLAVNNLKAKRRAERTLTIDTGSIVVSVEGLGHGICLPGQNRKSSYGLYFGRNSPHNRGAVLPEGLSKAKEVALLSSAYMALDYIHAQFLGDVEEDEVGEVIPGSSSLKKVIIMTDAEYLVKCMTEYVWVWEENGYKNSAGKEVVHTNEIWDMSDIILTFERMGIEVRFWMVGRGSVKEANNLATEALSSYAEKEEEAGRLLAMRKPTDILERDLEPKTTV